MNTDILREQRVRIDELDEQLICLLAERFEITKTVGELKAKAGLPAADPKREKEQIARLHEIARREGMDPVFGEKVFRLIVDEVIRHHLQTADEHGMETVSMKMLPVFIMFFDSDIIRHIEYKMKIKMYLKLKHKMLRNHKR